MYVVVVPAYLAIHVPERFAVVRIETLPSEFVLTVFTYWASAGPVGSKDRRTSARDAGWYDARFDWETESFRRLTCTVYALPFFGVLVDSLVSSIVIRRTRKGRSSGL
ncbi:hypothetical protein [Promicromonospora sp. NPDC060271]|uniref:hypothetical protein n=1 Tax=Promicromonospora sp. NPDC060271 TaxID=3347089 RepID=UPI003664052A